jgi:ergothioneine biosynthesis protein EgtB
MFVVQNDSAISSGLLARLAHARTQTDELFELVRPEFLYERPIPERHRIIFYIGHLESFDWNLLCDRLLGLKPFHPDFDRLFAFGIDPVDGGLPSDQSSDWPSLNEVRNYVREVRDRLDHGLEKVDFSAWVPSDDQDFTAEVLLNVAIEHRLMHAETLAYMFHRLPHDQKIKPAAEQDIPLPTVTPQMVQIPGGTATLGMARDGTFGWDNEFEQQVMEIPAFAIDKFEVTNRQFLEFMNAGGYADPNLWSEADWKWKVEAGISHPVFWEKHGPQWFFRGMFELIPLPGDWPVYVSQAEASAYARWVGKSLPTEAQWHRAAYATPEGLERPYPWGNQAPDLALGNFDFRRWNPTHVAAFAGGQSAFGVVDLLGNGWEWTSTVFAPLPGFRPFSFYRGYSADFFDGKHYVIKGGSMRTAESMLRRSFRNWFQSHYQFVYAGFRCVTDKSEK